MKNTSELSSVTLTINSTNLASVQDPSISTSGSLDSDRREATLSDRSQALISGLQLVLEHHRIASKIQADLLSDLYVYLQECTDEAEWLKHAKHVLCYPLASYLKNEVPPVPRLGLFRPRSTIARKWWRYKLNTYSRRATHFWYSWFQGKRATLPVSLELVHKAYQDHRNSLSCPDSGDNTTIDLIFKNPTFLSVLDAARKKMMSILQKTPEFHTLTPSHSAGLEVRRNEGGQQNFLRMLCAGYEEYLNDRVEIPVRPSCVELCPTCLGDHAFEGKMEVQCSFCGSYGHSAVNCPLLYQDVCLESEEECQAQIHEVDQSIVEGQSSASLQRNMVPMIEGTMYIESAFDTTDTTLSSMKWFPKLASRKGMLTNCVVERREQRGRETWCLLRSMFSSQQENFSSRPLKCTIQAVLEPNKIRIISKGESYPYYVARRLQKALWGSLKEMPCFRLIGRPFSPTDLMDLTRKTHPSWKWFSIDYSAATDKLSWKYSGQILRYLTEKLPHSMRDLALRVLGPHYLQYPTFKKLDLPDIPSVLQANGQLMGSVLSFPILCLANLGVYLENVKELTSSWTTEDILDHVLVNGDDMVYSAPPSLWETHIDLAKKVGLEMSVGKAYVHYEYLNINSISVHYDLRKVRVGHGKESSTPWQINYLNVGLLLGRHKVQERLELIEPADSGSKVAEEHLRQSPSKGFIANMNTIIDGSWNSRQSLVLEEIFRLHSKEIIQERMIQVCDHVTRKTRGFLRNLFIPIALGGMGVRCPSTWKFYITKTDRRIAAELTGQYSYDTQLPTFPFATLYEDSKGYGLFPWEVNLAKTNKELMLSQPALGKRDCDVPGFYVVDEKIERSFVWGVLGEGKFSKFDEFSPFRSLASVECSY